MINVTDRFATPAGEDLRGLRLAAIRLIHVLDYYLATSRTRVAAGVEQSDNAGQKLGCADRHRPDRPEVIAGRDRLAGGSWFGRNDHGVFAAILNREGSLGPSADKRSRGELVLEALDHPDAAAAADALADLDANAYRSFNLVVGDNTDVFHIANRARRTALPLKR